MGSNRDFVDFSKIDDFRVVSCPLTPAHLSADLIWGVFVLPFFLFSPGAHGPPMGPPGGPMGPQGPSHGSNRGGPWVPKGPPWASGGANGSPRAPPGIPMGPPPGAPWGAHMGPLKKGIPFLGPFKNTLEVPCPPS